MRRALSRSRIEIRCSSSVGPAHAVKHTVDHAVRLQISASPREAEAEAVAVAVRRSRPRIKIITAISAGDKEDDCA